ncbi:hypothetical protein [Burkholderia multivorans]|uniref:hypothetical protein n=1 Tax=Burkholderia multivorans TaxID=87883 RepID=UPI0011B1E7D9|nr:hypothetical protein [Burkholderia multivorans]
MRKQLQVTIFLIALFLALGCISKVFASEKTASMVVTAQIFYPPHFSIINNQFDCDCQYVKPKITEHENIIEIEY